MLRTKNKRMSYRAPPVRVKGGNKPPQKRKNTQDSSRFGSLQRSFPSQNQDNEIGEDMQDDAEQPSEQSGQAGPSSQSVPEEHRRKRTTAQRNAALHSNWEGAMPELVWQRKVYIGSKLKEREHSLYVELLEEQLQLGVDEQLECGCMHCGQQPRSCMVPCPNRTVTLVHSYGSLEVPEPRFR